MAILLLCAGPDVVKVFDQIDFESANDNKYVKKVLEQLERYCMPLKKFWLLTNSCPSSTMNGLTNS